MFDKKNHWQNVYQQKSSTDVSWYQETPEISLELIGNAGVDCNEAIIDVGGGSSRLVDHLDTAGYTNLAVLDISEQALIQAKNRLGERGVSIDWFEADITQFDAPHPFSLWHDRAVFHFLTETADRQNYMRVLSHALRPGGHLIISAFAIGGPEKCSDLEIVQYDLKKLQAELGEGYDFVEETDELHITPAQKEQKFIYFRFIKKS
ncbi:MAG: class I SAM-dependent methyltransferase [Gammaproteobacteria bacterium]|nr:class I SAM-dependent methyltransferase [Gammaproteobacteria bacterium]